MPCSRGTSSSGGRSLKTWVKLYTEINRDPKFGSLTWAQRGIWAAMLALAGQIDDETETGVTGLLGTIPDTCWHLRLTEDELQDAMDAFTSRDMVYLEDGKLYLTHFPERQKVPPSAAQPFVTERVRQHRLRVKRACNEDVTSVKRIVTLSDPDPDPKSDPERDPEPETAVAVAPENGGGGVSSDPEMGTVWAKTLAMLSQERGNGYGYLLGDAELMELTENTAVIRVRDEEVRDLCRDRLQSLVSRSLLAALGFPVNVRMDLEFCTAAVF